MIEITEEMVNRALVAVKERRANGHNIMRSALEAALNPPTTEHEHVWMACGAMGSGGAGGPTTSRTDHECACGAKKKVEIIEPRKVTT